MEISSNSDLLKYATPDGSFDPTEDSFLEDFEVIREGDGDDHSKYPIRNCRTPPSKSNNPSSSSAPVMGKSAESVSTSSSTSTDSQLTSLDDVKHYIEENLKLKDRLKEMKETLNSTKTEMTDMVKGYHKACEEDKKKYKSCQDLAREAVEENALLKEQLAALEQQIKILEGERKANIIPEEADFVNLESLETQLKEKVEQLTLQEKKLDDLATHLEHEKTQNADLKKIIRTFEPSKNEKEELEVLRGEVVTHMEKISQMNAYQAGRDNLIESLRAQSQSQSEEIEALKTEISTQQKRISQMNTDQIERNEMIDILRAQYESSLLSMTNTDQAVAAKEAQYAAMSKTLSEKQVQIQELQEALAEKNQCFSHVNTTLNERDMAYNELHQIVLTKNAQLDELKHAIDNGDGLRQKYQERLYSLEDELRNSKQINDNLDREVTVLKTSVAALSTENESISHWKAQCDAFQADYLNMLSQRDTLDTQIFELNKAMTELQEKAQKQQDELDQLHNTHIRFAQEHINKEPSSEAASVYGGNQVTQSGDILSHVINNLKRGVSLFWEGDASGSGSDTTTTTATGTGAASAPLQQELQQKTSSLAAGSSELPPCPVCRKVFYSYGNLQEHCWDCGKDPTRGSHLDPFVFVPHQ